MSLLTSLLHQLEPDILPSVVFQLILQVSQQSQTKHTCALAQTLHLDHHRSFLNGKSLSGKTICVLKQTIEYENQNLFLVFYFS